MNERQQDRSLVVMNGAIAAGKDTVSVALAGLLEKDGHRVAVVGLDELWTMIDHQQPRRGGLASWLLSRRAAAAVSDLFFASGYDHVIVNGSSSDWTTCS